MPYENKRNKMPPVSMVVIILVVPTFHFFAKGKGFIFNPFAFLYLNSLLNQQLFCSFNTMLNELIS